MVIHVAHSQKSENRKAFQRGYRERYDVIAL